MKPTNLVNIDFDDIRESIKSYLRTRNEFTDYDFTGSTLSYLIDVLAYNTYYSSFNANMALNEVFLDSASIRDNVVSLARYINYLPRSVSASKACVTCTVQTALGVDGSFPTTVTLRKGDVASGIVGGQTYTFVILADKTVSVNRATGVAIFDNFKVYEGNLLSFQYVVNTNTQQNYIIPNDSVDTETISVYVRPNIQSTQYDRYNQVLNVTTVEPQDKIYFLNETEDRRYELTFGDGIVGRKLEDNEVIYVEYVRTNGAAANNVNSMSFVGTMTDSNGIAPLNIIMTLNDKSQLGAASESIKSIKFNAPKYYAAQNRAVTARDYEAIIRNIYPNAKYVNAFGGEVLSPPIYGKVIVAIKTSTGTKLNNLTRNEIISKLRPYAMASVETVIVDPDDYYINLRIFISANTFRSVLSDSTLSQNTSDDIRRRVLAAIQAYGDEQDLGNFGQSLSISQLEKAILNADPNINDVQFGITPYQVIPYEDLTDPSTWTLNFGTQLNCSCDSAAGSTVQSSVFYTPGVAQPQYLQDDGNGNLVAYYVENNQPVITNPNAGTYNCDTGQITVGPLTTQCPQGTSCPVNIVISVNPSNANSITPPAGAIINIPTPEINIGTEIPPTGPGASTGNPNSLAANPETLQFTSPISISDGSSDSCFA